jgi:hypothetical protein
MPPGADADWKTVDIDWEAGTVQDVWGEAGPRHRVLLILWPILREHWYPPEGATPSEREETSAEAELVFKSPDWSLGSVLSWIAFNDPLLICRFDSRRDLLALRMLPYDESNLRQWQPMLVPNADHALLDALKGGGLSAIRRGAELPSAY